MRLNGIEFSDAPSKKGRIFHNIARKPPARVPFRDINRGWIQTVNLFCRLALGNSVNAIVIYHLFCLSDACRDCGEGRWL